MDNLLEEIVERQKLSRFDTVMLLAYPLLLSGMAASFGVLSQRAIQDWFLRGVYEPILGLVFFVTMVSTIVSILWLVMLAWNFINFIRAYLGDDIRARMRASHNVVRSLAWLSVVLLTIFAVLPVFDLATKAGKGPASVLSWILALAFGTGIGMTASSFWNEAIPWFAREIARWSEKNLPHMLASAHVSFADVLFGSAAEMRERHHWRLGCMVVCIIYSIMIALAIQAQGLAGTGLYYIVFLIVLIAVTIAIIFRARPKTILRAKKGRQTRLEEYANVTED